MKYLLMHKTTAVLQMEIDESVGTIVSVGEVYNIEHLPVGLGITKSTNLRIELNNWWKSRSIPASRYGIKEALEVLDISDPQFLLTKSYGLSLSDQYWVRPENTDLQWQDINFFDNTFSEDVGNILMGGTSNDEEINLISPDNTSDGWLRKKWKIINGKRCMIKGGSNPFQQEPLNEVITTNILNRLGIPHIPYSVIWDNGLPYSVCEDFITPKTELVSAWHIMQTQTKNNNLSSYQHFLNCCESLKIPNARENIDKMLTLDYLIVNTDRHFNNFGAVRDADTLEWIGIAPIYDSGTSLWHDQAVSRIQPMSRAIASKPFRSNHADQIRLVNNFEWLDFSALKGIEEDFSELLKTSEFIEDARQSALCYGIKKRVDMLRDLISSRESEYSENSRRNEEPEER